MNNTKLTTTRLFILAFLVYGMLTIQIQAAPGDLDPSFGNGGIVSLPYSPGNYFSVSAVAIQTDGKVVVAGSGYDFAFALVRYLIDFVTPPAAARRTQFDFDGDGRADVAVFRLTDDIWYIQPRNSGNFYGVKFGTSTDKIVPADYDGDGKADIAVYRNGIWYLRQSSNNTINYAYFGSSGDVPTNQVQ